MYHLCGNNRICLHYFAEYDYILVIRIPVFAWFYIIYEINFSAYHYRDIYYLRLNIYTASNEQSINITTEYILDINKF